MLLFYWKQHSLILLYSSNFPNSAMFNLLMYELTHLMLWNIWRDRLGPVLTNIIAAVIFHFLTNLTRFFFYLFLSPKKHSLSFYL